MILSNEQLREVVDIIRNHHYSFVYKNISTDIDPKMIINLRDGGYIKGGDEVKSYFKDAYEITRLKELIEVSKFKDMTYDKFKRFLFSNPVPMTDTEASSINHIQQTAGQYITKQGDLLRHATEETIRNKNMDFKADVLSRVIKTPLQAGIEQRKGIGEIVSELREGSDDQFRDWHRIAQTELQNARNHAAIDNIYAVNKDKPDKEILIYKRPNPDACKVCKSVYLEKDGVTPKVFTMSEFKKNITNYGLKTKRWMPTIETVHPWCQCEMATLPPGFGFDKKGHPKFKGLKHKSKVSKPQSAEKQMHLYDSDGNLKKSKFLEKIKSFSHNCELQKSLESTGKKKFTVKEILLHANKVKKQISKK